MIHDNTNYPYDSNSTGIVNEATIAQIQKNEEKGKENIINKAKAELQKYILELFHTDVGDTYALVKFRDKKGILPLKASELKKQFTYMLSKQNINLSKYQIEQLINSLEGQASYEGEERELNTRVAKTAKGVEIDLNDGSGNCILVTQDSWRIAEPEAYFIAPKSLGKLPTPETVEGGELNLFKRYFRLKKDSDLILLITLCIYYLMPETSYPITVLKGPKGSGKSTATSMIKGLLDPETGDRASPPRNEEDLYASAAARHISSFDNMSNIKKDMSDALCRLSTGGTYRKRALYSAFDESSMSLCKPIIINGIPDLATKSDLINRIFTIELEPISSSISEEELWAQFNADKPRMLSYLLSGLQYAIADTKAFDASKVSTRFSNFAKLGCSLERFFGWRENGFADAVFDNKNQAVLDNLNQEPVVNALWSYFSSIDDENIKLSSRDLLERLNEHAGLEANSRKWPSNAQALSNIISILGNDLEAIGIKFVGRDRTSNQRFLVFERLSNFKSIEQNNDAGDAYDDVKSQFIQQNTLIENDRSSAPYITSALSHFDD